MSKCIKLAALVVSATLAGYAMAADLTVVANKATQERAYYAAFKKASGINVAGGEYNVEMAKVKVMVDASVG